MQTPWGSRDPWHKKCGIFHTFSPCGAAALQDVSAAPRLCYVLAWGREGATTAWRPDTRCPWGVNCPPFVAYVSAALHYLLTALCNVSAAPSSVSATPHYVLAAPRYVSAAPCYVLAAPCYMSALPHCVSAAPCYMLATRCEGATTAWRSDTRCPWGVYCPPFVAYVPMCRLHQSTCQPYHAMCRLHHTTCRPHHAMCRLHRAKCWPHHATCQLHHTMCQLCDVREQQ